MKFTRPNTLYFDSVTSTNDVLRQLAQSGAPDGTAVVAGAQTAGRGRMGRTFQSPAGLGLYLSVLYRPEIQSEKLLPLTAWGAAAVCRALEELIGTAPQIKWPNDLVMGGRKIGGILTESALCADGTTEYVILGAGINVRQSAEDFCGPVKNMAASLAMLGYQVELFSLANSLLCKLHPLSDFKNLLEYYSSHCLTVNQKIVIMSTNETADALCIDPQYGLQVRYDDGREDTLRCGEVSVRGLYGYTESEGIR